MIDPIDVCFIDPTFVQRDLHRFTVMEHSFFEEPIGCCLIALCRQEKVGGFTLLINGMLEIFPNAFHVSTLKTMVNIKFTGIS
jgi:hypothetical protein